MFIRRTPTRCNADGVAYHTFRLVESRREGARVRLSTLLNLGSAFDLPEPLWPDLCVRLVQLLGQRDDLLAADVPEAVETLAQTLAARLIASHAEPLPECEFVEVDVASLELTQPRSVGVEQVGLHALAQLEFEPLLESLGINAITRAIILAQVVARMAAPGSELATWRWLNDTSALGELRRLFSRTRHTTDIETLIQVMVLNRLCDPDSKLGVLRWLETVALPEVDLKAITHQQLLRSMDALMDHQTEVDAVVAGLLRPLIDQDLSVVFYDLTTIRCEGLVTVDQDVRQPGLAKEGLIARQFMLGVVQTAEKLPLYHEVFDGNVSETKTLLPTLSTVLARFPSVRRLILIADRGFLSLDNLESLQAIVLSSCQPLEFIIAVPGRRYADFVELLGDFHRNRCAAASAEIIDELAWNDLRLVVAHDPAMAATQTQRRSERIDALITQGEQWAGKLAEQDEGVKKRGRKLSDSGAKTRFFLAVSEAHLSKIIKVNLTDELFSYDIVANARSLAEMMDGKLLLVTNVQGLTPAEIVTRYKSLADFERGFKVLKSEIEIGPVYHRLPERIKAHASICFMALILHRVMRTRLRDANTGLTPERALEQLRRIQHHRIRLNGATPVAGVSSINGIKQL